MPSSFSIMNSKLKRALHKAVAFIVLTVFFVGIHLRHKKDQIFKLLTEDPSGTSQRFDHLRGIRHVFSNVRCPKPSHNDSSHRQLVIILTTSHVKNRALRDAQREAFSKATLASLGMWRVFLLFESEAVPPETVQTEAAVHEDILQGTFPEAYRNLAYKHLMGLDWAFKHCHHFRYVLKSDDDIMVDFFQLRHLLVGKGLKYHESTFWHKKVDEKTLLLGYLQSGLGVHRSATSKWALSKEEFPDQVFPDFVSGWAYLTTPQAARRLVQMSTYQPLLWIDDVWITGILRKLAGIFIAPMNDRFTVYKDMMECCTELTLAKGCSDNFQTECSLMVGPSDNDAGLVRKFGLGAAKCKIQNQSRHRTSLHSLSNRTEKCSTGNPYFLPDTPGIGEVFKV